MHTQSLKLNKSICLTGHLTFALATVGGLSLLEGHPFEVLLTTPKLKLPLIFGRSPVVHFQAHLRVLEFRACQIVGTVLTIFWHGTVNKDNRCVNVPVPSAIRYHYPFRGGGGEAENISAPVNKGALPINKYGTCGNGRPVCHSPVNRTRALTISQRSLAFSRALVFSLSLTD